MLPITLSLGAKYAKSGFEHAKLPVALCTGQDALLGLLLFPNSSNNFLSLQAIQQYTYFLGLKLFLALPVQYKQETLKYE